MSAHPILQLSHYFRGHISPVTIITGSPDGTAILSADTAGRAVISDTNSAEIIKEFANVRDIRPSDVRPVRILDPSPIRAAAWAPSANYFSVGNALGELIVIGPQDGFYKRVRIDTENINALVWSPTGKIIATGSSSGMLNLWSTETEQIINTISTRAIVRNIAFLPSLRRMVYVQEAARYDGLIRSANSQLCFAELDPNAERHELSHFIEIVKTIDFTRALRSFAVKEPYMVVGDEEGVLHFIDCRSGWVLRKLVAHGGPVIGLTYSPDGEFILSKGLDSQLKIWNAHHATSVYKMHETSSPDQICPVTSHPTAQLFFTSLSSSVRSWQFYPKHIPTQASPKVGISYTSAKIVLVGDSGVGKTALGSRLAKGHFEHTLSSHGQQFWILDKLRFQRNDGTDCEAVLWDLAGQPDYRILHSLFLEDVDLVLLTFDATESNDPLGGIEYWLGQLRKDGSLRCNCILVVARSDRGAPILTERMLRDFCSAHGIKGGFVSTSAVTGQGVDELVDRMNAFIGWERKVATIATETFRNMKNFILRKKEDNAENILVASSELRQWLSQKTGISHTAEADFAMVIGHLANHGFLATLEDARGKEFVLLRPDLLNNVAASMVIQARGQDDGVGALDERRLLRGDYPIPELQGMSEHDAKTILETAATLFLKRNLCFRETTKARTLLIFPALINEVQPPAQTQEKVASGSTYRIGGRVENIYAMLVVLMGYTNEFTAVGQWRDHAEFHGSQGQMCGFRREYTRGGALEISLYFEDRVSTQDRALFQVLLERLMLGRGLEILRDDPVVCPVCKITLARNVVARRVEDGHDFGFCVDCGHRLSIGRGVVVAAIERRGDKYVEREKETTLQRTAFEVALVRVKGIVRDRLPKKAPPSCFICYAWGVAAHERWVRQLAFDLRKGEIEVTLDRWLSQPGDDLGRFTDKIMHADFVLPVGTPQLLEKYDAQGKDPVVAAELSLINHRLMNPTTFGRSVIPILLEGDPAKSLTPQLLKLIRLDFRFSPEYFLRALDLIWRLHDLPADDDVLHELHQGVRAAPATQS